MRKLFALPLMYLMLLPLFAVSGWAQASMSNGPATNCPNGPKLHFDYGNNVLYGCGSPLINGSPGNGGPMRVDGLLYSLAAPGNSTVINASSVLNGSGYTMYPGQMNGAGKHLHVVAYGTYSNTTSTPTFSLALVIGGVTVCQTTSTAVTNGVSAFPWRFEADDTVTTAGATGADEAHCTLTVVLGASATAAASTFMDNNTAASSTWDHTAANTIQIGGLSLGASNAAQLRSAEYDLKR